MAFRVGQKVMCVDALPRGKPCGLKKDAIYTIIGTGTFLSAPWATVAEAKPTGNNIGFFADRFRPVVSTNTGMAVIEQIRRDVTNKELRPIFEDEQA